MTDALFTFLFKYRSVVFEDGRFAFESSRPWLVTMAAVAVVLAAAAMYLRQRSRVGTRPVALLVVLRTLAVALVAFALLHPVISISTAVPGENFLAVMIDDSRSMQLTDEDESSRGSRALTAFAGESSAR